MSIKAFIICFPNHPLSQIALFELELRLACNSKNS